MFSNGTKRGNGRMDGWPDGSRPGFSPLPPTRIGDEASVSGVSHRVGHLVRDWGGLRTIPEADWDACKGFPRALHFCRQCSAGHAGDDWRGAPAKLGGGPPSRRHNLAHWPGAPLDDMSIPIWSGQSEAQRAWIGVRLFLDLARFLPGPGRGLGWRTDHDGHHTPTSEEGGGE